MENLLGPLGYFTYEDKDYPVWSSFEGRYRTEDPEMSKFNRYAKLGKIADKAEAKFKSIVKADPTSREGRLAYACLLMMKYGVRIGNEDSAEGYESQLPANIGEFVKTYGVTTLLPEHVTTEDNSLVLNFLGKKQVEQNIKIDDPLLIEAGMLYLDEIGPKTWLGVDLGELTSYIKHNFGEQFVPKDLRTWCANVTAFDLMRPYLDEPQVIKQEAKEEVKMLVAGVAAKLGNTLAVAKSSYLDARMLDWFISQRTIEKGDIPKLD